MRRNFHMLIDPVDLSKSELLSSTLRPHHGGPNKRPIFPGSNDRAYQILAAWVNSLRPPQSGDATTRPNAWRRPPRKSIHSSTSSNGWVQRLKHAYMLLR